jgi:N-acetylglucosaminyldiphosphoundecaprenol N-acetyl-beta-D-mannosaminyltransferase
MRFWRTTTEDVLNHIFAELRADRGGWLLTANLDFLRRYVKEPEIKALYDKADMIVADGMPIVWATRLQGDPLPERVPGATLIYGLAHRAEREGRSMYLLGGEEGAGEGAARVLVRSFPGLRVTGWSSPRISPYPTDHEIEMTLAELRPRTPDVLLVGLGSPKQERLIRALRSNFPKTWMVGVGVSFSFLSGSITRAPSWIQNLGLEWAHRLAQEPRRLARRYLLEDLPFAAELFGRVLWARGARRRN